MASSGRAPSIIVERTRLNHSSLEEAVSAVLPYEMTIALPLYLPFYLPFVSLHVRQLGVMISAMRYKVSASTNTVNTLKSGDGASKP